MNDNETLAFRHGSFDPRGTVICPLDVKWCRSYVDMFRPHIL
jgi:hypothetical protein